MHAIETQVRFSFPLVSMVEGEATSRLYPSRLVPWDLVVRRQLSRGEDFYVYEGLVALTASRNDPVVLLIGSERIKDGSDAGRRKGEGTPRLWS